MALRQNLTAPLIVEPLSGHTHTVLFLHRFPADTDDKALSTKVLSRKRTQDGKTLRLQFPTVRWVFPHAKLHPRPENGTLAAARNNINKTTHWENLTTEDCFNVGLELGAVTPSTPYITQLILQEAKRAGGLDRVILGGQGETALAAHDALGRIWKTMSSYAPESELHSFVQQPMSGDPSVIRPWRLAGFVGMHLDNQQTTRDERDFWLVSKFSGGGGSGPQQNAPDNNNNTSDSVVRNTPHEFIRGGYKQVSSIWDGQRIDDFAEFLARVGPARGETDTSGSVPVPTPAASTTSSSQRWAAGPIEGPTRSKTDDKNKEDLSAQQKHAEEIKRQKQRDQEHRQRVLRQIEDQKVERQLRLENERLNRFHIEQAALEQRAAQPMVSRDAEGVAAAAAAALLRQQQPPNHDQVARVHGNDEQNSPKDQKTYATAAREGLPVDSKPAAVAAAAALLRQQQSATQR
ncbi:hypothetical protein PG995_009326 [Apiospora arundinis]